MGQVKKKYDEFLGIMKLFFDQQGYQKSRKKGEYHKAVSGKIIKIRIVLSSVRNGGNLGEIRVFAALEYPELEKIVSILKEVQYKKGNNLFTQDIALLCGKRVYYALNFSSDSNMENAAAALRNQLVYNVFPIINKYAEDKKIFDDFESYDTPWRYDYFSVGRVDIDFYLRWISLCVLYGYINEAFAILEHIPGFYGLETEKETIKYKLKELCSGKEQESSSYLLVADDIYINPGKEEFRKGLFRLDGLREYFLILEDSKQGNYLQIAGGSGEYTVEIRLYNSQGYVHYRAEAENEEQGMKKIFYGGGYLDIQACQVLSMDQAYEIACQYLLDQKLHKNYNWVELLL